MAHWPSSARACGPFCACCPVRHAVGLPLNSIVRPQINARSRSHRIAKLSGTGNAPRSNSCALLRIRGGRTKAGNGSARPAKLVAVDDLPALLLAGGMFGDFLGGLLVFASIVSMVEFKFEFEGSPKKRSKK
jgi:hypothetical protein